VQATDLIAVAPESVTAAGIGPAATASNQFATGLIRGALQSLSRLARAVVTGLQSVTHDTVITKRRSPGNAYPRGRALLDTIAVIAIVTDRVHDTAATLEPGVAGLAGWAAGHLRRPTDTRFARLRAIAPVAVATPFRVSAICLGFAFPAGLQLRNTLLFGATRGRTRHAANSVGAHLYAVTPVPIVAFHVA
jgi:hypothetical protein